MQIKVKKLHTDAVMPRYATDGAACFDLHAVDICGVLAEEAAILAKYDVSKYSVEIRKNNPNTIRTGLSFEIPSGYVMLIFSRSGHGFNSNVRLANCVGVIDADYRGEIMVKLTSDDNGSLKVKTGDRIAQAMIIPIPAIELIESDDLSETERGTGGFGSTGV